MRAGSVKERILDLLSDGLPHSKSELLSCFNEGAKQSAIYVQINQLRRILRPLGQDIVCVVLNGTKRHYRQIRILGRE